MTWKAPVRIGVGHDKFDAFKAAGDHVVDRVAAATADAKHRNSWFKLCNIRLLQVNSHFLVSNFGLTSKPAKPFPLWVFSPISFQASANTPKNSL